MKITVSAPTNLLLYNAKSNKTSQAKALTIEAVYNVVANQVARDKLLQEVTALAERLRGAHVIGVENTDLIRLLEPKTGATVHNFLAKVKEKLVGESYAYLGDSVPADTVNGDKVLVLGSGYTVTLEGLAQYIFAALDLVHTVRLHDGPYLFEVSVEDFPEQRSLI